MNETEALAKMVSPGMQRPNAYRRGIVQILVTRACTLSCFNCTQNSQLRGKPNTMSPEQFEEAVVSLKDHWGVVGTFGGCPTVSPHFDEYCEILQRHIPFERRGLWCNDLLGKGEICRKTFNPGVCNINVHGVQRCFDEFRKDWPEVRVFGMGEDSRHAPTLVSMIDLNIPEEERWELISRCDINQNWSSMIGLFRGQLRGYFCEVAGAQAILHQDEPDYPDAGSTIFDGWWRQTMTEFAPQVRQHCHHCSVPLRGYGELAVSNPEGKEQVSLEHFENYKSKKSDRLVQLVTDRNQLGKPLETMTHYLQNSHK